MLFKDKKLMNIVITMNCDSKCKHCYIKSVDDSSSKDLSVSKWKETFLKFKESGGQEICIHGGEPLMYKGISDLLLYANEIGLSTSIITNTYHLDDSIITALVKSKTYVLVSLDGPKENYTMFRGADKLDIVIKNIDKMLEAGITIHPISVIHNKNIDQLSWTIDFVLQRNIKTVTLSPLQPIGRASEQTEFHISPENINRLMKTIDELNNKYNGKVRFVTQALYNTQSLDDYLHSKEFLLNCNDDIANVTNDGRVVMNLDLPNRDDFEVGTILDIDRVDIKAISNYKNLINEAYFRGLNELKKGNAINFFEIMQRQAFEMMD